MNKLTTVALSVSMALALGACSPQQEAQSEQSSQQKPAAEKQQEQQLTSGIVLENFDKSARPQDDLNQYVNGAWMEKTEIPDDRSSVGSFFDLRERNQERLHKIIEKSANMEAAAGTNERKVGDFFNAYMDVETLNELGAKPIQSDLESINAIDSYESVAEYFAHMSRMSTSIPFGFYVYPDAKDPQTNAMYVSQSGLGLPDREYYLSDEDKFKEFRTAYVEYISDVMEMAGVDNAEAAAERVLELETKLAEAQWTRVESRNADKTYNKMTASEVDELLGSFDFSRYLSAANLSDVDNMVIRQPSYFEKLGEMFTDVDLQTWKDYLSFKVINDAASILSEDFSNRRFAFYGTTLRGIPEQEPRWKRGVDATNSVLGEVLGQVYVKEYFPPEAKEKMEGLIENLRAAYADSIQGLDWMTDETKEKALEKLAKFDPKVGYPNEWRDYSDLDISSTDLVGNYKAYAEFNYNEEIEKIGGPVDEEDWGMTPQTVNAYYSPVRNEIVFPAGILQPPFFDMNAEMAVNYGGIGAVIGHEMGHGFDDQGSKYDGEGNLNSWWTDADREAFDKRGKALSAQYSAYEPIEGVNINGDLTLGENIGDLAGLTIAYEAYMKSLDGEQAPVMDGFTGPQRVFIGWAQVWRGKYREDAIRQQVLSDPHSPAEYRVNGTVVNVPAFYEAFDVKPGDELYVAPENRVTIW
ncbi:M13 family metallopeptidase [Idiomarina sp. UBA3162]|uniref:M13 family metallopeptidase n=1 Tax=Idiomarina sp. UBA3162 TaxID=1946641 RepID=UPI000C8F5DDD|nr:M13 family metallopeptidase [Idiomarina sp. UBA3162]MAD52583.1 peptidase M13 [Idiomarinaceae bacterium]|tara:strand:+ start:4323 stop:6407 length:2085 start_codon:yes stop_codon:yes gene_type:complete